ncbi:MAG: hypothetical protein M0C28_39975 [Candidatus Moduliflexus flocculans]|nr:hypothetical protein [Candidatus Moduliflexus flocculans]
MPLEVLRKLGELVEAGATVVGRKPVRASGLAGFPACDDEVKALADRIWGACDGAAVKERAYGKGRIVWGIPLERHPARSRAGARLPGARHPQRRSAYRFHPSSRRPRRYLLRLQQRQGRGSLRRGLPGRGGPDARVLVSRHGPDRPLPFVRPGRGRLPADVGAPGLRLRLRRLPRDADAGGLSCLPEPLKAEDAAGGHHRRPVDGPLPAGMGRAGIRPLERPDRLDRIGRSRHPVFFRDGELCGGIRDRRAAARRGAGAGSSTSDLCGRSRR